MRWSLLTCGLLASGAAAAVEVVAVRNGGLLFTDNQAGVSGTDAGYSIAVGDRQVWLFGDVFLLGPDDPEQRWRGMISNCAAVTRQPGAAGLRDYQFISDPATGLARPVLTPLPAEAGRRDLRYWPLGGWHDPASQRLWLYYGQVAVTGTGPFDFRLEGHGLAAADATDLAHLQFTRLPAAAGSPLWWRPGDGQAVYGSAVAQPVSGPWCYVVGYQERGGAKYAKLARVDSARVAQPAAYEYFAGGEPATWSSDPRQAADLPGLRDFPSELSLSHNAWLGGWLAVHSVGLGEQLRCCLAPQPWGPYQTIGTVGSRHKAFTQAFCYAGKEHPALATDGGRTVLLTYVDSARYWLQALWVTFGR
ncbi:MAG: DUF4185 domain-containing protein [Fimbriimonadaceae bacterium]|nr:DUF4185 domain-containing protein [Fimbriimonadaceae bacterium]